MKKSLIFLAALAACGAMASDVTQRASFNLVVAGDPTCEAKSPAKPMKPKPPGKPGKKCIEANVPLDDGYMLAKAKGPKKAKKVKKQT